MFKRLIPTVAVLAMVLSAGLLTATEGTASATPTTTNPPRISVSVTYPSTGSSTELATIVGSGFTPGGNVWVGVYPTSGLTDGTTSALVILAW